MAAQLKDTPTLSASESRRFVRTLAQTTLTPSRKEELQKQARMAHEAYKKPIK